MSAFIVPKEHIDLLVTAGLRQPTHRDRLRWYWGNPTKTRELDPATAHDVGQMLWGRNLASVAYRYPNDVSGTRPGPNDFQDSHVTQYRFQRIMGTLNEATVLKAIQCYEYQSCEDPDWEGSEAKAFCETLLSSSISRLPGYEQAPWGFTNRAYFLLRQPA